MSARLFTTAAAVVLLGAGTAFAECDAEIRNLEEAMLHAETGATEAATGMPATEHQEEVLADDEAIAEEATAAAEQPDDPATLHQEEVTAALEPDAETMEQAGQLLAEAREMAAAGDQEGCMQRVEQAQALLDLD
jgi:hypothetical protein